MCFEKHHDTHYRYPFRFLGLLPLCRPAVPFAVYFSSVLLARARVGTSPVLLITIKALSILAWSMKNHSNSYLENNFSCLCVSINDEIAVEILSMVS